MSEKILITGGAGFIGQSLISLLEHANVLIYDNFLEQVHRDRNLSQIMGDVVVGDVNDYEALENVMQRFQPSHVVHLAAETGTGQSFDEPFRHLETNVNGTANLALAIRSVNPKLKSVILASSRAVYGEGIYRNADGVLYTDNRRSLTSMQRGDFELKDLDGMVMQPVAMNFSQKPNPQSLYASTKLMQEYILKQLLVQLPCSIKILRLQNVYGAGQSISNPYTGVLSHFAAKIIKSEKIDIFEDGNITRDFVNVADVATAICKAISYDTDLFCDIGSGKPIKLTEIADIMVGLVPETSSSRQITGEFRPGDIKNAFADTNEARSCLNWDAKISIEDGLSELIHWARGL